MGGFGSGVIEGLEEDKWGLEWREGVECDDKAKGGFGGKYMKGEKEGRFRLQRLRRLRWRIREGEVGMGGVNKE